MPRSQRAPRPRPAVPGPRASAVAGPSAPPSRAEVLAVAGLALAYAALFSTLCAIKYHWFLYTDFDLAIFSQATGGILRGTLFSSIRGMVWPGDHQSLILFLIAPLYALFRHPITLLTLQSVALAGGAFPVWRLARRELGPGAPAVMAAALYLLYPALGYVNLFEFHPEALATPLLLAALEGAWAGAPRRAWTFAALALLTREDVTLAVAGLALAVTLARRPRARAVALGLVGLAAVVAVVDFGVLRPWLGGGGEAEYGRMYAAWGDTPGAIVLHLLREPWNAVAALFSTPGDPSDGRLKLLYWLHLLLPLAGLSLLRPVLLLPAAPILIEHLLSSRMPQHTIVYQYTSLVTPFLVAAAVLGAARVAGHRAARARAVMLAALGAGLVAQVMFGPLVGVGALQGVSRPQSIVPDDGDRALQPVRERMVARIPRHGGVVAGFEFLPRLADRDDVHSIHHLLGGHFTYSQKAYPVPGGIVAVLADVGSSALLRYMEPGTAARWRELESRNDLHPVDAADDLVLDLAGARDTVELVTSGVATTPAAHRVTYAGRLALVGAVGPAGEVAAGDTASFALDWARVAPIERLLVAQIVVVDTVGRVVVDRYRYLGYTRYPADRWPAGEVVRERYRMTLPEALPPGRYALGVRVWDRGPPQRLMTADDPQARRDAMFTTFGRIVVRAPARR